MPNYTYQCDTCGREQDRYVAYEDREKPVPCTTAECVGTMAYTFPVSAALGFQPFTEYFDEALGLDIHGRKEKAQVLRSRGLQEAGDKVGGARNHETSPHAARMVPLPPQGVTLSEVQRRSDTDRAAADEMAVGIPGVRDPVRVNDLPAPRVDTRRAKDAVEKAVSTLSSFKE